MLSKQNNAIPPGCSTLVVLVRMNEISDTALHLNQKAFEKD